MQVNQGGVNSQQNNFYVQAGAPVGWPQRVGMVPALASAFQDRAGLRATIETSRTRRSGAVSTQVLTGGGGVGKSQLAAAYAIEAARDGVDLLVWVDASGPDAVVAAYAQTAGRVQAPGGGGSDAVVAARALLDWLATTERTWLIVLDDITEPERIEPWWPTGATGNGRVLATTRRRDAILSDHGRTVIDVDVYDEPESAGYLAERLTAAGAPHLLDTGARPLTTALGHLPLALSHAAAYMVNEAVGCAAYLGLFTDRRSQLDAVLPSTTDSRGWRRSIGATLLVALDAAQACEPIGLALPALRLAAVLDPAGHPDTLWTDAAVVAHLSRHNPAPDRGVTVSRARAAMRLLHRYGLLAHDPRTGPRAVRVHALTARAVRETTPPVELEAAIQAVADALLDAWPDPDTHPDQAELVAALRTNTAALIDNTAGGLWYPNPPEVLLTLGDSLLAGGLPQAAIRYWEHLIAVTGRLVGHRHPGMTTLWLGLADAYRHSGRTAEAITIEEQMVADRERNLGDRHPNTLSARINLAASYWQAGRVAEAITIEERVVVDNAQVLGDLHPNTLTARMNLAASYRVADRHAEAIELAERVAADCVEVQGDEHPQTLTVLGNLASSYREAGRVAEAIPIEERVLAASERALGEGHPGTVTARANLAASYADAGRIAEAIPMLERVINDNGRVYDEAHPSGPNARLALAGLYWKAERTGEAITTLERLLADSARFVGEQHPQTVKLAAALREWQSIVSGAQP
ncbi:FxSxx-COOH system tetratricopeptide repeat protein [Micromonospora sp. NPDC004704]